MLTTRAARGVPTDDADSLPLGLGVIPAMNSRAQDAGRSPGAETDDEGYWYGAHCLMSETLICDGLHVGRHDHRRRKWNLLDEDASVETTAESVYLEHRAIVSGPRGQPGLSSSCRPSRR